MSPKLKLLLSTLLLTVFVRACLAYPLTAIEKTCRKAYDDCDFLFYRFAAPGPLKIRVGSQENTPVTPFILSSVNKETHLGVMHVGGITPEIVQEDGSAIPITALGFPKSQFKPLPSGICESSAIGYETFQGDLLEKIRGKCIRMYFTDYAIHEHLCGSIKRYKRNVPKSKNKCVAFMAM